MLKWIVFVECLLGFAAYYSHSILMNKLAIVATGVQDPSGKVDAFFAGILQVGSGILFVSIAIGYIVWTVVKSREQTPN